MTNNKTRILIIDDAEEVRETMKAVLEGAGYIVDGAATGAIAFGLVQKNSYDIFLVDYMLPDTNGIDLTHRLLAVSKDSIPIIITGSSSIEIAVNAMHLGAHDYLMKPVNLDDLLKILENILVEREALRNGKKNVQQVLDKIGSIQDTGIEIIISPSGTASARQSEGAFWGSMIRTWRQISDLPKRALKRRVR
jgi:DNA-binding NtrC family response regulator